MRLASSGSGSGDTAVAGDQEFPKRFGRYEALAPLGRGGMGEVFIGRLRGKGGFTRSVAIKSLLPHLTKDERTADLFLAEARNAARIDSPHVVQTFDVGENEDGRLFLVMELVDGENLDTLTEMSEEIPIAVALEVIAQAADGLDAAHRAKNSDGEHLGLVHCDVSPQNIMIGSNGVARIVDFGIAKAAHQGSNTVTNSFRGKICYVAPELADGAVPTPESDLFSLGIVLWEMLTGQPLFDGLHPAAVLEQVKHKVIPPVHEMRSDVPPSIADVVGWALQREVDARPANAALFAQALRSAASEHHLACTNAEVGHWVADSAGPLLHDRQRTVNKAMALRAADQATAPDTADAAARGTRFYRTMAAPSLIFAAIALAGLAVAARSAPQNDRPQLRASVPSASGSESSQGEDTGDRDQAGAEPFERTAGPETEPHLDSPILSSTAPQTPVEARPPRVRRRGPSRVAGVANADVASAADSSEQTDSQEAATADANQPTESASDRSPPRAEQQPHLIGIDAFDEFVANEGDTP